MNLLFGGWVSTWLVRLPWLGGLTAGVLVFGHLGPIGAAPLRTNEIVQPDLIQNVVTATALGTVRIRASQGGNDNTAPVAVERSFRVAASDSPPLPLLVWADSPRPTPPFNTWETAATNIQDAIAATRVPGATVWVRPGTYRTGSALFGDSQSGSRVVLTNRVTVRSTQGPEVTILEGSADRVRGASVDNGCELRGFTLTRGEADRGGGAFCGPTGRLVDCILTGNSSSFGGGGVWGGLLEDCTLSHNLSRSTNPHDLWAGGGACLAVLRRCRLVANGCFSTGGGAYECELAQCWVLDNWAGRSGGGVSRSQLTTCVLTGNSAASREWSLDPPGGAGGGATDSTLVHCTVVGNSAAAVGGGVYASTVTSSVLRDNQAPEGPNYPDGEEDSGNMEIRYSCTSPLLPMAAAVGNIDLDPRLVTTGRLSADSPCLGAADPAQPLDTDIDGEPWQQPAAMGADQPYPSDSDEPLDLRLDAPFRRAAQPGIPLTFIASGSARVARTVWDFGDGTRVTNRPVVSHAWREAGPHTVVFSAWPRLDGSVHHLLLPIHVGAEPSLVDARSVRPEFPYLTWETAATTIQEAIAAAPAGGGRVWVTNGVYRTGEVRDAWRGNARVALSNHVSVASVNGAEVTVIEGAPGGLRVANVEDGSTLEGFTLTGGSGGSAIDVWQARGGAICCDSTNGTIRRCKITDNASPSVGGGGSSGTYDACQILRNHAIGEGGGVWGAFLVNCLLAGNSATHPEWGAEGGGAASSTLIHCTVTGNSANGRFGGTAGCPAWGSIIYYNEAPGGGANFGFWSPDQSLQYCCVDPSVNQGENLGAEPRFVDAAAGDYRLRPDSPCLDRGVPGFGGDTLDLAGSARVVDGDLDGQARADIGALEFVPPLRLAIRPWAPAPAIRLDWPAYPPGARLLRSPSLVDPVWSEVPESRTTNAVVLPAATPAAFYQIRLP